MNKNISIIPIILLLTAFMSFSFVWLQTHPLAKFKFLEGTWKRENKPIYEKWTISTNGSMQGSGYVRTENNTSEYLSIKVDGSRIIYTAQVPDQNAGKAIEFVLNEAVDSCYSFVNKQHDFPKEIQYKPLSTDTVKVYVLGENQEGFSFLMIRQ